MAARALRTTSTLPNDPQSLSPPVSPRLRIALRPPHTPVAAAFTRAPRADAPVVCVVGGGFSGVVVAAQLLRQASEAQTPLHVVVVDPHAAFGEGLAYRTSDARHLLNVPASNMSAWPDRPGDFREWAKARGLGDDAAAFLPRRAYGEYVRHTLAATAEAAFDGASLELLRAEATEVTRGDAGWSTHTTVGRVLDASAVVLATGHRPPDDALGGRWVGPRARYVEDPWASLALSGIGPEDAVVLLGSGLTAVDVLLTLTGTPRTGPVLAVSRRGLAPTTHAAQRAEPLSPSAWLEPLLASEGGPTTLDLVRALRSAVERADGAGQDWRAVIDGLRADTARTWRALSTVEAKRFLRHARAFWEVRRHRMSPGVGTLVDELTARGTFRTMAARVVAARADAEGVALEVRARGAETSETLRAAWVVNCTGPGTGRPDPIVASLLERGLLEADSLGLGVLTDDDGRARVRGATRSDLVVVGTLRKPQACESTAVPELRVQARDAARAVLEGLEAPRG